MAFKNQQNYKSSKDVQHSTFHASYIGSIAIKRILYIGMLVAQFYPSRKFDIEQPIVSRLASDVGISSIFGEVFLWYG